MADWRGWGVVGSIIHQRDAGGGGGRCIEGYGVGAYTSRMEI